MKVCCACKVVKPLEGFYKNGLKVDGTPKYNSWCKACRKQKMRVTYNVQLVTKQVNKMKWDLGVEEFVKLCKEVVCAKEKL